MAGIRKSLIRDLIKDIHIDSIDIESRIIYFAQEEDDECCVGPKSSVKLTKNIDILNKLSNEPITIKMISCDGGNWDNCLSICQAIKSSDSVVNIDAVGLTASCGSVILQMGANRRIGSYSGFMIHCGTLYYEGYSISAESTAEANKLEYRKMLDMYAERCKDGEFFKSGKYSLSRIKGYLDTKMKNKGDWYLKSAEEVVYYGFADSII